MSYTKVKDSTSTNIYGQLLEQAKQLTHTNTRQEPSVKYLNYPDPVKLTKKNATLRTRIKQLEPEKNTSNTALFPSYNKNLMTVADQSICNRCKKVVHIEQVCKQKPYNHQHNTNS